jgi:hypothetical protein
MGDERGAICLVEQGGQIFLVRAILESGQPTNYFEFATSAGSGNPLTWHLVPESPETRLEPLYSGEELSLLDRDGTQAWPASLTESKSDFARRCNVHPARVGQWLRSRQIDEKALVGRGPYAKIIVDVALEQLRRRRGRGWREREKANPRPVRGA